MPSKKPRQPKPTKPQMDATDFRNLSQSKPRNIANDGDFPGLVRQMQAHFDTIPASVPLFRVAGFDAFDVFIRNLPVELRAHYTCNACRGFFNRFASLVIVNDDGTLASALWGFEAAAPFDVAVYKLKQEAIHNHIVEAFVSAEATLGQPTSNGWDHFAVKLPPQRQHRSFTESVEAASVKVREEMNMLKRALEEFPESLLHKTLAIVKSGSLVRPEKAQPQLEWLIDLHDKLKNRNNLLWLTAATAPAGFCHVRSGVIGTLLEDVQTYSDVATIARKWAEKLDPTLYMRAQVAPSAGNLKRAEQIIANMEAAGSLRRRYVTDGDYVEKLWSAKETKMQPSGPVFGHIAAKQQRKADAPSIGLPETKMTWEKFARTLLPEAIKIEYHVPAQAQLAALVTAVDKDAPPILQWDGGEQRNPVSVYSQTAPTQSWNLTPSSWVTVKTISPMPYHWNGNAAPNQKQGVFLSLDGCRDASRQAGGGFLPEFVRAELREVRASLDAYARSARVEGGDKASACGVALMKTADVGGGAASVSTTTATNVILVFDESGSMGSWLREMTAQTENICRQLRQHLPGAEVTVVRFGSQVFEQRLGRASGLALGYPGSDMGNTALYDALAIATNTATANNVPTLIYLFTDGEENASRRYNNRTCAQIVTAALSTGRVSYGCVGPRSSAANFFSQCGIPSACVRAWDGSGRDFDAVTQQVGQGIAAYADARSRGMSAIEDFFTAPVSGFGDGVRLRVTMGEGAAARQQVVVLDRWD